MGNLDKNKSNLKRLNSITMFTILFSLVMLIIGITAGLTYAGFQSTATSNGTLTFAVNGHKGQISISNCDVRYDTSTLTNTFTILPNTHYSVPTSISTYILTIEPTASNWINAPTGWTLNNTITTYDAGTITVDDVAMISANAKAIYIVGSCVASTYTITYNANGGSGTMSASTPSYGSQFTLKANAFTRTGYSFLGWATTAGGDMIYGNNAPVLNLGDTTLYAKWAANELTFNNQNKSVTFSSTAQNITFTDASNGTGSYTYSITAGNDDSYFSISGATITAVANAPVGSYNLAITATDGASAKTRTVIIAITINPITLGIPTVSISDIGVVTWNTITGASSYDISIDGTTWTSGVSSGYDYFNTIVAGSGTRTVRVRANPSANYDASKVGSASITTYAITVAGANGTVRVSRTNNAGNSTTLNFLPNATAYIFATANSHYHFVNWTKSGGNAPASTTTANTSFTVNVSATHTANFAIDTHTITYDVATNGGTSGATTASVNYGTTADLTKIASKTDWTFVGWNTSSTATTALSSCTITANTTLYAIFSRTLTIYYNNNGATGSVVATIYNTATSGTSTTNLPAIASRSGWTIYGWANSTTASSTRVDNTTTAHVISITTTTTGSTYYATYTRTLTLSYNANGGSSTPSSQTATQYYNSAGNTSSHSFTLANAIAKTQDAQYTYSFNSWTQGSTSGTSYNAGASVSINADTTFYAKWNNTIRSYTVTYNATTNGGSTTANSVNVNYGNSADLTKTASKSGWTFVGWNTSSSATNALGSYTVTSNVTLYAIFSRTLTMNYNNNGSISSVSTVIYNNATSGTSSTNLPAVAGKSGWSVYGWSNSTAANSTRIDGTTTAHAIIITTSNTGSTYYATYSRTLTLSYNANGGNSTPNSQTTTQYYNSAGNTSSHSFTLASAISRNADAQYTYSFNSWGWGSASGTSYNAGASVSINSDTVFYAKWNLTTLRYYTVYGMEQNVSVAYGSVLTIGVGGVQGSIVGYELTDANGNELGWFEGPVSTTNTCYLNGVRIAGMAQPYSGSFTVTGDCYITFGSA